MSHSFNTTRPAFRAATGVIAYSGFAVSIVFAAALVFGLVS